MKTKFNIFHETTLKKCFKYVHVRCILHKIPVMSTKQIKFQRAHWTNLIIKIKHITWKRIKTIL